MESLRECIFIIAVLNEDIKLPDSVSHFTLLIICVAQVKVRFWIIVFFLQSFRIIFLGFIILASEITIVPFAENIFFLLGISLTRKQYKKHVRYYVNILFHFLLF